MKFSACMQVAVGHTPYVDLSFEQIAISKATCDAVPLLAVDAHGARFSQVSSPFLTEAACFFWASILASQDQYVRA